MKTITSIKWLAVSAAILTAATAFRAAADQPATAIRPESHYTGTVVSVDPKEHVLTVNGWWLFKKAFNLGDGCAYKALGKNNATADDLRPGEKVMVSYQDASGVLIADRVEQQPMRLEGMVKTIDPATRTMTVHVHALDMTLQIAGDCNVVLRNEKSGTLADIQVGDHVTVTYEKPDSGLTARQIAQTSIAFTGKLTAVDLDERTVKARSFEEVKKFSLADNCAIVINGKPDGKLGDLRLNDRLVFSYDEINGVNVLNRIAPVPTDNRQTDPVVITTPLSTY